MSNWKKVKINDIVEIIDGDRGKNYPKNNEFFDNEYCLFLNTKNVSGEIFCFDNKMFITKEKNEVLRKGKLKRGDYVLTTRGTIGNFAFYSNSIPFENIRINSGMVILRTKNNIDRNYFGCYLSSQFFKNEILQHVSGSAQPQLPIRDLKICDIILPPLKIQQKIASVLGAYDDLIEINNRRIKISEEMAQLIYKEWFVKFKFPGHEKVKMKNGVPEGWEEKEIQTITDIQSGYAFKRLNFNKNGEWGIVTIKNVQDGYFITDCTDRISEIPKNMNGKCYLNSGDILISLTGNIGRVCLVYGNDSLLNQRVAKLIPTKPIYYPFVYTLFRNKDFQKKLEMLANGVAQQNLSPVETKYIKVKMPQDELLKSFYKKVNPMLEMIVKLYLINKNLRETRDLLLPKLMSGGIEI